MAMVNVPNYASALRCIGQALENQNIDVFELIADKDQFVIECGDPIPPYKAILRLYYSPDRIRILDREGQARRRQMKSYFRFDSLPEILRATGKYIDSKRAELRRLNNCPVSAAEVEVEYQTRAGDLESETLAPILIRDIAVNMYKQRARTANPIDLLARRN